MMGIMKLRRQFTSRVSTSVFHFERFHRSEHEEPIPHQHDGGPAAHARRLNGRPVHQLSHDQALRRLPVLHQRNPLK